LARANKQLTESDWSGLTLREIIKSELEPYLARCEITEGNNIILDRQNAQNFSLVLHELATNAIKYGALSNLEGRVYINWGSKGDGRDSHLIFQWREQGGPPVVAPKRQGFGSTLLRATFADARSNFDTNGFNCEIELPFREAASIAVSEAQTAEQTVLTIFAAGTLAVPFKQVDALFEKQYPNVTVQAQYGGSVTMAKRIADLNLNADLLAVADYSVIPKYMFGSRPRASWYAGFARNAITFVYTEKSKYANEINSRNWYKVLARPGVEIGRSNPDTDPSGYRTVQMLNLAEKYYKAPGLAQNVLANAPPANMRDTETALISALQLGQIDYLAIYRSDALQHHLKFIDLPAKINLGDPAESSYYQHGIANTNNGDLVGKPIVYAVTVVNGSKNADWAEKYVSLLLGPQGQAVMRKNGFGQLRPAYAVHAEAMPATLKRLVEPWPGS
jgi:molybdate/tungstate transport system substrate-binding protein